MRVQQIKPASAITAGSTSPAQYQRAPARPGRFAGRIYWLLTLWLVLSSGPTALANTLSRIRTVFIIVMENQNWSTLKGSTNMPYLNSALLPESSYCEQYYNPPGLHPSLTDYLWLEAGTNFGIYDNNSPWTNNCTMRANAQTTTNHLVTYLNNAGVSWKTYQEDMPTNVCQLAGFNQYVVRHNPFAYFDDIVGTNVDTLTCTTTNSYGVQHMRPYTELAADLANGTVARYNFFTPNLCSDMHSPCSPVTNAILQGDLWLSSEVPKIMNSAAYRDNGVLIITWEEAEFGDSPIGFLVLSPLAKGGGYAGTNHYTHSSTLRTMQEIFGVRPFLGDAANATDLSDLFKPTLLSMTVAMADGCAQLSVTGAIPGTTNVLQFSNNLSDWASISTNLVTADSYPLNDCPPLPSTSRFYRLLQLGE